MIRRASPRVWGKDTTSTGDLDVTESIPTRVGKRAFRREERTLLRDHPHACGEKLKRVLLDKKHIGSSPRVWGKGPGIRI